GTSDRARIISQLHLHHADVHIHHRCHHGFCFGLTGCVDAQHRVFVCGAVFLPEGTKMNQIVKWFRALPAVTQLLLMGGVVRLISVLFSKGFGWHDDHFLIIEASQSWADGFDYNYWLPDPADPNRVPQGHSLFYVGLHYYLFMFLEAAGFVDPQGKMYVVRALHAALSLIIIKYAWIITKRHAGERAAWYTGLMMALFWFMPFMS